jgi:molybdopterin-guanine dinucleotide biosynthesis protein A
MGRDKALLEVGGTAMARRVADALLAAGAAEVVAIGGDLPALAALGLDARPDSWPGDGPLPATLGAFTAVAQDVVLVVSCDLVAPDPDAMATVAAALTDRPDVALAIPRDDTGELQWTHAAWRRAAAGPLEAAWEAGARSLRRAAADLVRIEVTGLPPASLVDADSPGDLPG